MSYRVDVKRIFVMEYNTGRRMSHGVADCFGIRSRGRKDLHLCLLKTTQPQEKNLGLLEEHLKQLAESLAGRSPQGVFLAQGETPQLLVHRQSAPSQGVGTTILWPFPDCDAPPAQPKDFRDQ